MKDYVEQTYGELIAAQYDEIYAELDESLISVLAELADGGAALELGSGTGRAAVPLAQAGVEVHGIDVSQKMTERLKSKPGGEKIQVTIGTFAEFDLGNRFDLIYVIFNTFFGLLSQSDQVRCVQSVAGHLKPDGAFLIEAFVPDLTRFNRGQRVSVVGIEQDLVRLDISELDASEQVVTSQHIFLSAEGVKLYPVKLRYAYPSELDLMAEMAGMGLRERWSSWKRDPFVSGSPSHISVYQLK